MKCGQEFSLPPSYHVIVLDHHTENDQRIIRHITHCKQNNILIDRIRFNMAGKSQEWETDDRTGHHLLQSPITLKGGALNYARVYLLFWFHQRYGIILEKPLKTLPDTKQIA